MIAKLIGKLIYTPIYLMASVFGILLSPLYLPDLILKYYAKRSRKRLSRAKKRAHLVIFHLPNQ